MTFNQLTGTRNGLLTSRRVTHCTFLGLWCFPLTWSTKIILNLLLGLLLEMSIYCVVLDNFYAFIRLPFVHIWFTASVYLEILDKVQRKICNVICPDLASWLQSLSKWCVFSINIFMVIVLTNFPVSILHFTNLRALLYQWTVVYNKIILLVNPT